jgi:hypothetical protein
MGEGLKQTRVAASQEGIRNPQGRLVFERSFGEPVGQGLGQDGPPPAAGLDDLPPDQLRHGTLDDPNVEPGQLGQDGQLGPVPLPGRAVEGVDSSLEVTIT